VTNVQAEETASVDAVAHAARRGRHRVAVVVLGDLTRSPRTLRHALSLARAGYQVDLIGYQGEEVAGRLAAVAGLTVHTLPSLAMERPHRLARALFAAYAAVRGVALAASLLATLVAGVKRPSLILVQNPPAIPTLAIAWLAARLRGARWIIDWHSIGQAHLAQRLGRSHWMTRSTGRHERRLAARADAHLCVSQAMARALPVPATVVYDRPAAGDAIDGVAARRAVLAELGILDAAARDRTAVLVSSTSWTPDEDLSLLFEVADAWDRHRDDARSNHPDLQIVVTGRGPARADFDKRAQAGGWKHVRFRTSWLPAGQYPRLLAAADVGICCHVSASGIDLPIKVQDFLAAGLPSCVYDYGPVLREILEQGRDAEFFSDAATLTAHLLDLLEGFPDASPRLDRMREHVKNVPRPSWDQEWTAGALAIFDRNCGVCEPDATDGGTAKTGSAGVEAL